jgi:hypothetical protein
MTVLRPWLGLGVVLLERQFSAERLLFHSRVRLEFFEAVTVRLPRDQDLPFELMAANNQASETGYPRHARFPQSIKVVRRSERECERRTFPRDMSIFA